MNRDYPLAPTVFKDKEYRSKKKAARQENNQIKKEERVEMRKEKKIERSSGLEYETPVRKRHMR
jgi:superfamily I DNA/RNA helicase